MREQQEHQGRGERDERRRDRRGEHHASDDAVSRDGRDVVAVPSEQHSTGKTVVIDEVVLTGSPGWVVINEVTNGAMGGILGESTLLPAGTSKNVTVTLMHPLTGPATVEAVLHLGDNNNTTFDFPNGDLPAKVGGEDVEVPVPVLVP